MKIKKTYKIAVLAVCAFFAFSGCSTTKNLSSEKGDVKSKYFDQDGFYSTILSNGINLFVKQNGPAHITTLRIYFVGGSSVVSPQLSGIDDVTLEMLLRGSEKYTYEDIQKVLYNETSTISSSGGRDSSSIGFRCIKISFSKMLDLITDGIFHPSFNQETFENLMNEEKSALQSRLNDPSSWAVKLLVEKYYKDTVYEGAGVINEISAEKITLDDVKANYKKLMNASRIFIAAAGNFNDSDIKNLLKKLNKTFSKIEFNDFEIPSDEKVLIPEINWKKEVLFKNLETAGSSGYIMGAFKAPRPEDSDYVPFAMATMVLDNLLFEKVREEKGSVYSIGMGSISARNSIGVLSCYKASDKKIRKHIISAIREFPTEEILESKIEEYKNKYITKLFENGQTVTGIVSSMAFYQLKFGDFKSYLNRRETVLNVTAREVRKAFETYISNPETWTWAIVSGEEGWEF